MSLVAVAAIAASLLLTRGRDHASLSDNVGAGENPPVRVKLDAIRAVGGL